MTDSDNPATDVPKVESQASNVTTVVPNIFVFMNTIDDDECGDNGTGYENRWQRDGK